MRALVVLLVASAGLAGCVPFPRYVEVRPETRVQVVDEQGEPVPGAQVLFVVGSNPHGVLHERLELITDERGEVYVDSQKKWDAIMPFMIHGIAFYYRAWCVEKRGFVPVTETVHEPDGAPEHRVSLTRGESAAACRSEGGRVFIEGGES